MVKASKGFTLAEVLISLVIIGIIAAITVPVIMANQKRVEYSTRLKKFHSTIMSAVRLSEIETGLPADEWDGNDSTGEITSQHPEAENWADVIYFYKYIAKHIRYSKVTTYGSTDWDENMNMGLYNVYLDDGTVLGIDSNNVIFFVDLNGPKAPNKPGRDQFEFNMLPGYPFNLSTKRDREQILKECKTAEDIGWYSSTVCSQLLIIDSFEFKEDYPRRL